MATATARHILVETEAACQALKDEIAGGADFAELAKQHSIDRRSGEHGGRMPGYQPDGLPTLPNEVPALGEALEALETMEISDPIPTELGWHILRAEARRPEYTKSFEEVADGIREKLGGGRQAQHYSNVVDSLRIVYGAKFFDEALKRFFYLQMNDRELFETAQSHAEPEERLALYEEIVSRFPDSDYQAEALFMIGFEYAESLQDSVGAREAFERFLALHPGHEMAASARKMLATLAGEELPTEEVPEPAPPAGP